jgi:hypothetical protein
MEDIKRGILAYLELLSEEELYVLYLLIREMARK